MVFVVGLRWKAGVIFDFFFRLELLLNKTLEYLYQCDHCDRKFVTMMNMRVHVRMVHVTQDIIIAGYIIVYTRCFTWTSETETSDSMGKYDII